MRALIRCYDALIIGFAVAGAATLAVSTALIVADVLLRNFGLQPLRFASALVEYAMLAATMGGAPWLVRRKGHVAVGSLIEQLPGPAYRTILVSGMILSLGVCAFLGWRAMLLAADAIDRGAVDIRSIDVPGWVAYALLSLGLILCATEFLRLLILGRTALGNQHGSGA
ncbi:TRAP transporter small permease [Amorphus orientalis]|uniref:TRAP transporter small permease protein n=1 Tax=Amorphus orientalis TaxID=649198 RepID=A0AAE3VNU1_9HYPH|nr:TRAP transporter small permease [Amorphus orientalis]MDQ0315352.1 TRAP-type C4-dicarboxylate transport system permease small subunit [Amorphus orientalis]